MSEKRSSADDRKMKNFVIAPNRQFRLATALIVTGLFIFLAFFGFELWMMSSIVKSLSPLAPADSNLHEVLADSLWWSWAAFYLIAFIFSLAVLVGTIVVSHRYFGPVVALRRHIGALLNGEYEHRTHLRKSDELKELAADLNQLSEHFESRAKSNS
jgi:HAMP domain-containing protein